MLANQDKEGLIRGCCILLTASWGIVALPGCMHDQMRYTARRTTRNLPELQYQQIVDNLARIAANPGYLPYLAVVGQGAVQVTDSGSGSLELSMAPHLFTSALANLGLSRNVTGTWSAGTITSPEKIRQMQLAYRQAAQGASQGLPGYEWLHMGCRKEVPRNAVYVGRHGRTWVWVTPDGVEGLSELTLEIMDIATREDSVGPAPHALYRGEGPDALPSPVPRRNFQVPPMGPMFTPGTR
jgi:hypothetical protein